MLVLAVAGACVVNLPAGAGAVVGAVVVAGAVGCWCCCCYRPPPCQ